MGNLVFMIGNGFDLSCGMKTKYSDVYKEYIKAPSETKVIETFKKEIEGNLENWGDFELEISKYAAKLKNPDELVECIRDFRAYLNTYMIEEQKSFWKSCPKAKGEMAKEMYSSISKFYTEYTNQNVSEMISSLLGEELEVGVIQFNYTTVFDSFYKLVFPSSSDIVHIHGYADNKERTPVLGVDNEEQLVVPYFYSDSFRRTIIKPFFNKSCNASRMEKAKDLICNADVICVYGMSMGKSDLTWRNEIINRMKASSNTHLFLFKYENELKTGLMIDERMDIEEKCVNELIKDWKLEDFKEIHSRIHIPCGTKIFSILEAKQKDLKNP